MAAGDPGVLKRNFSATAIQTSLVNSISSAATGDTTTSVAVISVSGFPSTVPYTLILDPDGSKEEVVTVTAATSTTLTITRGQDSTPAVAHSAGTSVRHGVSGRDFKEQQTHIAARGVDADTAILSSAGQTHVHGLVTGDGSVVGADQLVTLTRKTLTTPTINGATLTGSVTASAATFASPTLTTPTVNGATITGTVTASTATIASPTISSPTISGTPVITGLSSVGMSTSSATPKVYVDAILGSATAASTSATSAATSATSAATSATSAAASASASASSASAAATSASSALTSQTAAATSATSAAASATAAATSATSAAASATAAATSATSATASATTASSSAGTATTQAANAATSATAAATSATSAAASATAAATSATSASTSATSADSAASIAIAQASNASASATAATTSATSAAASATAAATSATSAAASATAAATSATSAAASATAAADTYDNFDDRYLGAKSTPPTLDNDGNALLTGALYFNSTLSAMYVWTGSAWSVMATSGDIESVTAGTGLTGGGASGAVTVALDITSVYVVPSQTGNTGKYLTTDGTTSSWGTVSGGVSTSGGSIITVASGTTVPLTITNLGTGNSFVVEDSTNPDSTPFVIDASGAVAIGAGTPIGKLYVAAESASATVVSAKVGTAPGGAFLTRSANGTLVAPTISTNGDTTGNLVFQGYDGANFVTASSILGSVDGVPGTNDMPGRLMFYTTADGASSVTERMRIDSAGNVFIGTNVTAGQNTGGLTIQGKDIELMTIMGAF
jgi:hypothetical protein